MESRAAVQRDKRAWLASYLTLALRSVTCKSLRDLIHSQAAGPLWDELCRCSWDHLGPAECKLQAYVERHAHRAANVNVFGDNLDLDHLHRTLAAATRLHSLHLFRVLEMSTVDEITGAISGAHPTEAGVHLCALAPQLPCSVRSLKVRPLEAGKGWAWYQSILDNASPALAGLIVHRFANLAQLKALALLQPSGWVMTASCSSALCRRFPVLESLELDLRLKAHMF